MSGEVPIGPALKDAIDRCDLATVQACLEAGYATDHYIYYHQPRASIHTKRREYDAYTHAIELGYDDVFDLLLSHRHPPAPHLAKLIYRAITHGRIGIVEKIAKQGIDLDETLKYLQSESCKDGKIHSDWLCLAIDLDAADQGKRVQALLDKGLVSANGIGNSAEPLYYAIENDHLESIAALIKAKADVNLINGDVGLINNAHFAHKTPLGRACFTGYIKKCSVAAVLLLLKAGADMDVRYKDSQPLLHFLIQKHKNFWVETFISHGADIEILDDKGTSALSVAVLESNSEAMKMLLDRGANPNRPGYDGQSPMKYAARRASRFYLEALIEAGGNLYANRGDGKPLLEDVESDHRESLRQNRELLRLALKENIGQALLPSLIDENGRATKKLLTYAGYGLLPEIAEPASWGEHRYAEGWQTWRAVQAAMPPYWQKQMESIDTVALERLAVDRMEDFHQQLLRARKPGSLEGARR